MDTDLLQRACDERMMVESKQRKAKQSTVQPKPFFDLTDHRSRQLGLGRLPLQVADPVGGKYKTLLMARERHQNPLLQVQAQCSRTGQAMQARWQECFQNAQRGLTQAVETSQGFLQHAAEASAQQLRHVALATNRPSRGPAFASLSLGSAVMARKPQQVFDLALNVENMMTRVAPIPVYTVANKNNEFVLISQPTRTKKRQLGLFFLAQSDAKALVDKMKEQNPELADDAKVLKVGMDYVYKFHQQTDEALEISFRFMPDVQQVKEALQMFSDAGIEMPGFTGVPCFQAEGLTVKTDKQRYTPIFLDKADLDAAVKNAYGQRVNQKASVAQARTQRARLELQDAQLQVRKANTEESKAKAQAEADKAEERLDRYLARPKDPNEDMPDVQVGTLEELLNKMEKDNEGKWDEVMFIPPGATSPM